VEIWGVRGLEDLEGWSDMVEVGDVRESDIVKV
jgi:hypothetical protein